MSGAVVASAPGKIILMGEHAVVYGRPALVSALGLRARARVVGAPDLAPGRVEVCLPDVDRREIFSRDDLLGYADETRDRWKRHRAGEGSGNFADVRGDDPAHVVKVAVGEALRRTRERRAPSSSDPAAGAGVRLRVESQLPVGAGFGSSAAVAAAVLRAWLAWHDVEIGPPAMERLLLDVERRQHESPSGVDGATVLQGGAIWAEPRDEEDGLHTEPAELSAAHLEHLRVVDTGTPAQDTGTVVAAVRELRSRHRERIEGVLDAMGEATRRFRRVLADAGAGPGEVVASIRSFQRGLEELGVVPPRVRRLVRAVEARGGAAKISGAGALESPPEGRPGGGALLVYHPDPGASDDWNELEGLPFYGVDLGAEGQRVDAIP